MVCARVFFQYLEPFGPRCQNHEQKRTKTQLLMHNKLSWKKNSLTIESTASTFIPLTSFQHLRHSIRYTFIEKLHHASICHAVKFYCPLRIQIIDKKSFLIESFETAGYFTDNAKTHISRPIHIETRIEILSFYKRRLATRYEITTTLTMTSRWIVNEYL